MNYPLAYLGRIAVLEEKLERLIATMLHEVAYADGVTFADQTSVWDVYVACHSELHARRAAWELVNQMSVN